MHQIISSGTDAQYHWTICVCRPDGTVLNNPPLPRRSRRICCWALKLIALSGDNALLLRLVARSFSPSTCLICFRWLCRSGWHCTGQPTAAGGHLRGLAAGRAEAHCLVGRRCAAATCWCARLPALGCLAATQHPLLRRPEALCGRTARHSQRHGH